MTLQKLTRGKWYYLALAFLIPFLGFFFLMMIGGFTPFGKYSMLYCDMYHQYFPFFKAFREALLSGDSLLFSWDVGMGMDYLGLISYYLASPLNLLSVFLPENWLLPYFSFLAPVKLGMASVFFAIFLKKMFGRNDLSISLFGAFYGMCAWALGFHWNVMWLDTFALLPLVALGTISLLRDKKFVLYTITLFLSVFINYYIGLFTCIFVFLIFVCYQICRCRSIKRFFADLGRIALFSCLAIGMTAILSLPTLAALQTTQSSVNNFPEQFRLNIANEHTWRGLLDAMRQVAGNMAGGNNLNFKEGLPNVYSGVGTIILAFLFLTTKHVKLRDKICSVALLLLFMVSFIIRQLDYIWHGFHFTNMIPYRFSFLFSFVMLYMAYRAFLLRRRFKLWQLLTAGALTIGIFCCAQKWNDPVFLAYNGVFFLLYMGTLLYERWDRPLREGTSKEDIRQICSDRRIRKKTATVLFLAVMCIESVLNMVNFGVRFTPTYAANYPRGTKDTASIIAIMKELEDDDSLFYRAEVTHAQTLNDGALNSYNGISAFTSSANVRVTEFMKHLGYGAKNTYNRYCYEEGSPVSNLFLNLKYMIERDGRVESNAYFDEVYHCGYVYLLENNAYLPLGFLAESDLGELEFSATSGTFLFQNRLFMAATGITQNVWRILPGEALTITPQNVTIATQSSNGYCYYTASASGGTLKYTYQIDDTGFLCLDTIMNARNDFSVWKNGVQLYTESVSLPQTFAVSDVAPGDVVEVHVTCKPNEKNSITIRGGILHEDVFRKGYDVLNASTLELTHFSNTVVEGTIDCNRNGLLYTSIPQDGNWFATVDGQPVETTLVGNAMVAISLTAGEHTVRFTYRNAAFSLGWKVSLGCALIFGGILYVVYYPKYKKKEQ